MQTVYTAEPLNYALYVPKSYDGSTPFPLILFLHGKGERGTDPHRLEKYGLPKRLMTQPDFPCIVLSPQCPDETRWHHHIDKVLALLDMMTSQYNVDTRRIYLTGLSMGGQGALILALQHPERFAALVTICTRIPPEEYYPDFMAHLPRLQTMPIWIFHGARDDVVPAENAQRLAAALVDAGATVTMTIYRLLNHNSWDAAYSTPELYTWMLAQSLKTI